MTVFIYIYIYILGISHVFLFFFFFFFLFFKELLSIEKAHFLQSWSPIIPGQTAIEKSMENLNQAQNGHDPVFMNSVMFPRLVFYEFNSFLHLQFFFLKKKKNQIQIVFYYGNFKQTLSLKVSNNTLPSHNYELCHPSFLPLLFFPN